MRSIVRRKQSTQIYLKQHGFNKKNLNKKVRNNCDLRPHKANTNRTVKYHLLHKVIPFIYCQDNLWTKVHYSTRTTEFRILFRIEPEEDKILPQLCSGTRKKAGQFQETTHTALTSRVVSKNTRVRITDNIVYLPTQLVQIGISYGSK